MAGAKTHDKPAAKRSLRIIRNAAPGRRAAFAIAGFGDTVVMLAQRGKPSSAVGALRKMTPPDTASPSDRSASIHIVTSGLLYRVDKELVLQCARKPDIGKILKARKYFMLLKAGTPWSRVRIMRLKEGDEGDPGQEEEAGTEAEDDLLQEDFPEGAAEEPILDDWDDEPSPDPQDVPPPPSYPDEKSPPYTSGREPAPTDAARVAEAARVTRLVGAMAPNLQSGTGISSEALQAVIANLLQFMSSDRLLLALCFASNMEHLAAARDGAADGGKAGEEDQPLANDAAGHDRISRAFTTLGERIGRERSLVAPDEDVTAGTAILRMVQQLWAKDPQLAAEQVIVKLAAVLGATFRTMDGKALRRMLGLPAAMPAPEADPGQGDLADADAPWRQVLADARSGWAATVPGAVGSFARIKDAIRQTYGDEVDVAGPFAMLDEVAAHLQGDLADQLDGLLGETSRSRLAARRQAVVQAVEEMRTYLTTDAVASSLDDNDFVDGTTFIGDLMGHLDGMQALLAHVDAG